MAVSAFCREHSVSEPSFYGWRKRLKASSPVRFALVEASAPSAIDSAAIELVLVSGDPSAHMPGANTATLRTVLSVTSKLAGQSPALRCCSSGRDPASAPGLRDSTSR